MVVEGTARKCKKRNMAKRRTPKSQADDSAAMPAQPKPRRSRAAAAPEDTIGAYPGVERTEDDGVINQAVAAAASPAPASPGREPSDEDIRKRAYERYMARGANDGADFEDWLAAEQELRGSKV